MVSFRTYLWLKSVEGNRGDLVGWKQVAPFSQVARA